MAEKFTYLTEYLEKNDLTLRAAAQKCGRSATAVKSWCDGRGIVDRRVRARIATITGDTPAFVEQKVNEYLQAEHLQNQTLHSQSLTEICSEFKSKLNIATDKNGNLLNSKLQNKLKKMVDCIAQFSDL